MHKNQYPTVNYIGNKEKISSWICDQFPKDVKSVFDGFCGGCSLSFEAKKRGYKVYSNDILYINYLLSKCLIENSQTTLEINDVEKIFSGSPQKGFAYKNFSNRYFFPKECMQLDGYRESIEKLPNYKKYLSYILMRRAMIRKMPYSRFTIKWEKILQLRDEEYSYRKYKRRRAYHNESFNEHFQKNLAKYNNAIFDNKQENISYNKDIFKLCTKIKADLIYLDPPYPGTLNDYYSFYNPIDEYIKNKKIPLPPNMLNDKMKFVSKLTELVSLATNFKYIAVSYNNKAYPGIEKIIDILEKHYKKIDLFKQKHNYKITGRKNKDNNLEILLIGSCRHNE